MRQSTQVLHVGLGLKIAAHEMFSFGDPAELNHVVRLLMDYVRQQVLACGLDGGQTGVGRDVLDSRSCIKIRRRESMHVHVAYVRAGVLLRQAAWLGFSRHE